MATTDAPAALIELIASARAGRTRSIARLISLVEDNSPHLRAAMSLMAPDTGRAHVVGLTGPPGVGKSTTVTALITALRGRDLTVGVLAIDPSSPFSGGAVLGDRIRMQQHSLDAGVYIRSMASRGQLGGLSTAAPQALRVFDLAGFDVVLLETVGVGQSEVDIAATADTTLVLLAPGMGDGIQAAKAGILEIGDIFVVNKADRDGVQNLIREIRTMIALQERGPDAWKPPIVRTVASAGEGIEVLAAEIERHRAHQRVSGAWDARRRARCAAEIEALALVEVRGQFLAGGRTGLDELADAVCEGRLDPYTAADRLLAGLG